MAVVTSYDQAHAVIQIESRVLDTTTIAYGKYYDEFMDKLHDCLFGDNYKVVFDYKSDDYIQ